jgi:hypothetical protein
MRFWSVLMIVMVLTQAACLPPRDASTPVPPAQPSEVPTKVGSDNPAPDLPDGAVIVYRHSGGIAGLDETFTIYADGRVTSADGMQEQVSPQDVQHLLKEIEQAGFLTVDQAGPSIVPCCDRISYTLTVRMDGKTHTLQTYDGASDQPVALQTAMNILNRFLDANR